MYLVIVKILQRISRTSKKRILLDDDFLIEYFKKKHTASILWTAKQVSLYVEVRSPLFSSILLSVASYYFLVGHENSIFLLFL